ncbi:hypothetical protein BHM03_00010146 [Ensete ventricosum]|nr:hypothetical protein BHM03_00010146 [Ensete ventricosum]
MKGVSLLAVLCLLLLSPQHHVEAAGGFIRTRGLNFVLDGNPFFANGFNAYWLMTLASDPSQRGKVTAAFTEASSHGLLVARTWAFSDGGGNALQYSPGHYNERTFTGLDFVVSEARRYGIRLILSLANNYDTFGGKKQYVQWARNQGQYIASDDDFFTNPVVGGFYKNHVKVRRRQTFSKLQEFFFPPSFHICRDRIMSLILYFHVVLDCSHESQLHHWSCLQG